MALTSDSDSNTAELSAMLAAKRERKCKERNALSKRKPRLKVQFTCDAYKW
jgi:hypothetical protein